MPFAPFHRLRVMTAGVRGTQEGRNLGWLASERVLQLMLSLVVGAVVARHLGVEDYGLLAFAAAFIAVLTPFASASDGLAVRDIESGAAPPHVVLGNAAVLSAVATFTGAAVLMLVALAFPSVIPDGAGVLVLLVLVGVLLRPMAVVDYWFQARLDARRAAMARNISFAVGSALRLATVALDGAVTAFGAIVAAEAALAVGLLLLAYRRSGGAGSRWQVERKHLGGLSRQAAPLILAGLSVALYMRIDQVMLTALAGPGETGLYSVGVLLSEVTWFLPVALGSTLTPGMTRLWQRDRAAYDARLQNVFTLAVAISYAVVALSIAIGIWFIPLAYGEQFASSVPVFVILAFATPFVYLGVMQSLWTVNAQQQKIAMWRTGVAAAVNIVANLLLLPTYGAQGAAVTTVLSYATAALLANALFPQTRPVLAMQLRALRLHGVVALLKDPVAALRPDPA